MDISRFLNFRDKWVIVASSLILLTVIGYFLHWLGYSIYISSMTPQFIKVSPESVVTVFFLVYLIALFFIIGIFFDNAKKLLYFFKNRIYVFRNQDWPDQWIFSGSPYTGNDSELVVQSTRAGCLLNKHYWRNFRMVFQLKFFQEDLDKTIGIVFRARDLDNYFMLELSSKHKEIKPHVRYRGGWDVIMPVKKDLFGGDNWIGIILEVKNNTAYLYVDGHLEFTWVLPTHVDVMFRESGVDEDKSQADPDEKNVQEIPFRLNLGMVGFRAASGQGAIVKSLKIEPL